MSEQLLAGTLNLITNKQANKNMLLISIKNTVVSRISIHKQMLYISYLFQQSSMFSCKEVSVPAKDKILELEYNRHGIAQARIVYDR